MADKRLLSRTLVFGTEMIKLSLRARLLYIALVLDADDWGLVDIENALSVTGTTFNELNELVDAGFIYVTRLATHYLIRHWFSQNLIPEKRRTSSLHPELLDDFSISLDSGCPDKNYRIRNKTRRPEPSTGPVAEKEEELSPEDQARTKAFMKHIGISFES